MADKIKITKVELNSSAVRELLKSGEMMNLLNRTAAPIVRRLGPDYETSSYTGRNRGNVSIYTTSRKAMADNRKNNTVLKCLKGG